MTLKELLRKMYPTQEGKVPTAASLRTGDCPVVAEQNWSDGSRLCAFQNGYVLFESAQKATVFRADHCGGYSYYGCENTVAFSEEYFEEVEWWVRLLMEAEDRITHNQNAQKERHEISYECNIEEVKTWMQNEDLLMEDYTYRTWLQQAFSMMTERQREVVKKRYIEGCEVQEIADIYGVSHQAISVTLADVRKKFQKNRKLFE